MRWSVWVLVFAGVLLAQQPPPPKRSGPIPEAEIRRELERGLESENWQRVLEASNKLLPLYPKDPFLWWVKGKALLAIAQASHNNKMLQEAEAAFEEAIRLDENYLDAYIGKAVVLSLLGQDDLARIEMKNAVGRGYPVRELQVTPVLLKYLYDPLFFLELLEKERVFRIVVERDPFKCPVKIRQPQTPAVKGPSIPFHEQRALVALLRRAKTRLFNAIKEGDWQRAMKAYEQFLKQKESVLNKVSLPSLVAEAKKIIEEVEKRKGDIQRIKRDWLSKKAEALLASCERAINEKRLEEASNYQKELESLFNKLKDEKDPQTVELIKKYREMQQVLARRIAILKEFFEKILPKLRLTGIVEETVGEKVIRKAAFIEAAGQTEVVEVGRTVPNVPGLRLIRVLKEQELVKMLYKGENVELKLATSGK